MKSSAATGDPSTEPVRSRPSRVALPATVLGIGLGGLVDGIVLHQLLQWHHMVSHEVGVDTVLGLQRNVVADGLFHVGAWLAVLLGIVLLWRRSDRATRMPPQRALWGWMLVGWGAFDVVEGLVNHHLLGVHHVRDDIGAPLGWDLAFLAFGALLVLVGWFLQRSADHSAADSASLSRSGGAAR